MTGLIAPSRATSFEGLIFFVYDREAVKKEADPPENAIVYFYPPSASTEDRISICGQLIGMSHCIHGFIGSRPALCKLQTEKVATVHSGKYTLALGGSLDEPDSLLIRQLGTLHGLFTFYHGSLERVRKMCDTWTQFLTRMNVIWDCYLHFVRHYGDFLPGVFDPLPFLDLPKSVAATCFTKASYILQACQRRKHILGGCILYSNRILCTQFEPSITERLILLKPNQSNHPARPVKTEHALPFGVRILNAFLTLSEYLNLYEALAESAYGQPNSPDSTGAFPDMYMTSHSLGKNRNSSSDPSGYKLQQDSSGDGASSSEGSGSESTERGNASRVNFPGNEVSAMPSDSANGAVLPAERERKDSKIVDEREPTVKRGIERFSKKGCRDEGLDNYDQSSGKAKLQIQATGVGKISAKNSGEFKDTNEHVIVEKSQNTKRQNESGAYAQKAVKKAAEENNGSVASILLGEKRTEEEQKESEASTLLTWKRTGKKKDKSEASALAADKGRENEQNGSEASALAVKKRTGEKESGIDASALKTEKSFESVFAKTGHNAVDEGASSPFNGRSCETTFYDNVSLTMGDKDVSGFKFVTNSIAAFDSSSFFLSFFLRPSL